MQNCCKMLMVGLCECRWDDCFIRLLDGMLQVVGFTDKSLQDNMLKVPTRIRSITIPHPEVCLKQTLILIML